MGLYHSPRIVTDGLVLCLDAGNTKGYDKYENLWTYSEQFNNGAWGKNQVTVTANQGIAPDGTLTADLVTTNTVSAYNTLDQFPTLSTNTNYCYSVFVKLVSGSGTSSRVVFGSANDQVSPVYASWGLQLDTLAETSDGNTPTVKGYIPYPNGWYRLYMVINTSGQTNPSVGIRFGTGGADTVNTFYVWGAQLEKGSSVTDYYPTTATTKTRGTTWTDLSIGGGNNGTLVNGPTYNSSNRGSIVFDGVDDYITVSNVQPNTNNFTISVWVYKFNNTSNDYIWDFGSNGGTLSAGTNVSGYGFRYYNATLGTSSNMYTQGTIPDIDKWYNVSITRNSGTSTMYVNGSLITSSSGDTHNISSTTLYIGRYGGGTGYEHHGYISNFNIYNKALTALEVQQNFNAQRGRFGI